MDSELKLQAINSTYNHIYERNRHSFIKVLEELYKKEYKIESLCIENLPALSIYVTIVSINNKKFSIAGNTVMINKDIFSIQYSHDPYQIYLNQFIDLLIN